MAPRRRSRRILRRAGLVALPFVLLGLAAAALVATAPGRAVIARGLEAGLSSPGMTIKIGTLDLPSIGQPRIDRLVVSDAGGPWLEASDTQIDWRPMALLSGTVAIDRLAVGRIEVARRPAEVDEADDGQATTLPAITLGDLALRTVVLAEPVLGVAAEVSASGNLRLVDPAQGLSGALDIVRTDGVAGSVTSRFVYRPEDNRLKLSLDAREPDGGLIVRSLGVPGLPGIAATLDGDGTLDDWQADLSIAAADRPVATGTARLTAEADGRRLTVAAQGDLQPVLARRFAALLAGRTRIDAEVGFGPRGSIVLRRGDLRSDTVTASLTGAGTLAGEIDQADLAVAIARPGGRIALDLFGGPGDISADDARIVVSMRPDPAGLRIDARATITDIQSPDGAVATAQMSAGGITANAARAILRQVDGLRIEGTLDGFAPTDPVVAAITGGTLAFFGHGAWRDGTATVGNATVRTAGARAGFAGTLAGDRIDGTFSLTAADLSALSPAAGRDLAGAVEASGTIAGNPDDGSLALVVDGTAQDLRTGTAAADRLIAGTLAVKGGISRSATGGVSFDQLEVTGDSLTATVDGAVSRDTATLTARGRLSDIALIAPSLAGGVTFDAAISGTQAEATMTAAVAGTEIVISGHRLDAPEIRFTGTGPIDAPRGTMAVTGRFDGRAVEGGGMVSVEGDGRVAVEDLNLAVGGSRATGRVALGSDRVLSGAVSLAVGDLAEWRDLAGVDLAGAFHSDITLSEAAGKAGLSIVARGSDLTVDSVIIGGLVLDATIEDLFATAAAQGRIEASSVRLGDLAVAQVEVTARAGDQATRGAVRATLGDVQIGAGGTVRAEDGRIVVDLESGSGGTVSRIEYEDGQARMTDATFTVDAGRVTLNGVAGERLDLRARLDGVPARVAGAVVADLDARGTVSGDLALQGPASSPSATFTLDWQGASVAATRDAGLAAFAVDATGNVRDGVATLKGRAYGQQGFDLAFSGTAPAGSNRPLAITVKGSAPFNLLNPALAVRGGSIDGTLAVDLAVAGPIDDPQVSGSLTTSGARLNDPASGIAITNLGMAARLDGTALTLERLEGETPKGGRISAKGTVALATAEGLPANLTITARKVYIDDNQLLEGTLDADLSVTGALASGPLVAGMVAIARLDITVPDALPGAIAHLEVHHRNAGADVRRQVAALEKTGSARPSLPIRLDLRVDSGNRIFVRGRGLDVVLGGDISVTGTLDDPIVVGSFVQQRGKVDILGRSLTFSRGRLNFAGDLDPTLDFAATTTSSTTTITVYVTGQARDPQFRFASTPELPEDEVVSRFIFDRPVSKLTPLQIAQLSTEIARLGGLTGGPGLLGSLQKSLGLDVLEFTSDSAGSGAAAGKYVSDKVYLGVKQTTSGTSRAVIDLDITRTLKTKGEFGSDGSSKIGIGVEMDY